MAMVSSILSVNKRTMGVSAPSWGARILQRRRRQVQQEPRRGRDVPYFLSKYDPGALRFYPTAVAPEPPDTEACLVCRERSRRVLLGGFRRKESALS
jgi:hypothetical protein